MSLIRRMEEAQVKHVYREQNKLTDRLCKEGLKCTTLGKPIFLLSPPLYASKLAWGDIIGTTYLRNIPTCNNYLNGHTMAHTFVKPVDPNRLLYKTIL
ncbi:hypothetical protein R3W88_008139 [Solanum pinnatisectum]|uniref:RNase H type-1 domain-containing protein n=1 Tax=Solanum pinnatisectum TaxID=50273 RepID=A0AAV9M806_9SOLN|nr:hypothetical protein R3W88_008139 [Solanum pinnatisectum]